MVLSVQLAGVLFVLVMIYLTFIFYKRGNYAWQGFVFWVILWIAAGLLLLFPGTFSALTDRLNFARTYDFYLTLGLMFFVVLTFWNYAHVKRLERRMEDLVREVAIKRAGKRERKRKPGKGR